MPFNLSGKAIALIGVGLLVLVAVIWIFSKGIELGGARKDNQRLEGNVDMLENTAAANENASGARLDDAARQAQEKAELEKVTKNETDPAARRRAFYLCLRRQQTARETGRPAPACG